MLKLQSSTQSILFPFYDLIVRRERRNFMPCWDYELWICDETRFFIFSDDNFLYFCVVKLRNCWEIKKISLRIWYDYPNSDKLYKETKILAIMMKNPLYNTTTLKVISIYIQQQKNHSIQFRKIYIHRIRKKHEWRWMRKNEYNSTLRKFQYTFEIFILSI